MIYLFTALYCEAQIMIEQYGLKKSADSPRFQQFASESRQILLTVSGAGEIAAAAAVSSVCTKYPPKQNDFLVNVGTCAGTSQRDGIFFIHKLTEQTTGKTFYPDMLYAHGFQEAELCTVMKPWKHKVQADQSKDMPTYRKWYDVTEDADTGLYDMEAASIYQAGLYFFGPEQMLFLKVVSDNGEGDRLLPEFIRQRMETHSKSIVSFLEQLMAISNQEGHMEQQQKQERQEQWICKLCADLHCSKTMEESLRQHLHYAALVGIDYKKAVQELYEENKIPCKDKREGKRCFEAFKQRLF